MRTFYCCALWILVIVVNLYSVSKVKMATLNEITKEKQRLGEALTRVDAQREKLVGQLSELEAAERVLGRYGKGPQAKRADHRNGAGHSSATAGRRRIATAKPAGGKRSSSNL